jgi:hypothetical protein
VRKKWGELAVTHKMRQRFGSFHAALPAREVWSGQSGVVRTPSNVRCGALVGTAFG